MRPAGQRGASTQNGDSVPCGSCPVCQLATCEAFRRELAKRSWRAERRLGRAAGRGAWADYLSWAYGCPEIVDAIDAISREIDAEERAGTWPPEEFDAA